MLVLFTFRFRSLPQELSRSLSRMVFTGCLSMDTTMEDTRTSSVLLSVSFSSFENRDASSLPLLPAQLNPRPFSSPSSTSAQTNLHPISYTTYEGGDGRRLSSDLLCGSELGFRSFATTCSKVETDLTSSLPFRLQLFSGISEPTL